MRKLMTLAIGVALLSSAPLAASAQMGQQSGPPGDRGGNSEPDRRQGNGPDRDRPGNGQARNDDQYGRWDNAWGNRPPAPPKHFTKRGNWHQHVRACSARYRSYNPRTDTYQVRPGVKRTCRL